MKKFAYGFILIMSLSLVQAQDHALAEAYKKDGINYFIKSLPEADYEVLGEKKVTGVGKKTTYTAKMHGAAGLNHVEIAIEEINKDLKKKAKKGTPLQYDGIIVHKPKLVQYIKLEDGVKGAGYGPVGANAKSTVEEKSGKIIFYMSKPKDPYTVISEITYNQGGTR